MKGTPDSAAMLRSEYFYSLVQWLIYNNESTAEELQKASKQYAKVLSLPGDLETTHEGIHRQLKNKDSEIWKNLDAIINSGTDNALKTLWKEALRKNEITFPL